MLARAGLTIHRGFYPQARLECWEGPLGKDLAFFLVLWQHAAIL